MPSQLCSILLGLGQPTSHKWASTFEVTYLSLMLEQEIISIGLYFANQLTIFETVTRRVFSLKENLLLGYPLIYK